MTVRKPTWMTLFIGLVLAAGLPALATLCRGRVEPGCTLDGAKINPIYRVKVVDGRGEPHLFCCLRCARIWLTLEPASPRTVLVTDEVSGREIDAGAAWYVRSSVVAVPSTGNRVHVFGNRADAEKHAEKYAGAVLSDSETPFPRGPVR